MLAHQLICCGDVVYFNVGVRGARFMYVRVYRVGTCEVLSYVKCANIVTYTNTNAFQKNTIISLKLSFDFGKMITVKAINVCRY